MALKDLVSNLSNFKGQSQYDGLDSQIKDGVDYFPDDTSGAKGFTPKTDLLTKYNKFMKDVRQNNTLPNQYDGQANISAPNSGLRINTNKTRSAYGSEGEYLEPAGVGISKTSHILSIDNQLGIRVQPKFTSDFMITPSLKHFDSSIADYISRYNPPTNESLTLTVAKKDGTGNFVFDNTLKIPNANGSDFMTTPLANYVSKFQIPYDSDVYNVQQHISSGPTQFIIKPFENPPSRKYPNAHGSDFMSKINFTSRYAGSFVGAGSKTLGVLRVIHTADNPLATQNANYNSLKNEGPFNGVSDFSVKTTKRLYNDSSYIKDLFEFEDGLGRDTFSNVPSGINDEGNFTTTDFRTIANKGPFDGNSTHPIILRKPGSNWDNVLNESVIGGTTGDVVAGALGVVGLLTRTSRDLADKTRIFRFLISSKGIAFVAKQFAFQALNPTIESKIFNPLSTLGIAGADDLLSGNEGGLLRAAGSFLFPTHVDRHLGGLKYHGLETSALQLAGTTAGEPDGRLQYFAQAFAPETEAPKVDTGFSLLDTYANGQIGGAQGGLFFTRANPNKYAFPLSTAPKKVVDGRPHFIAGPLEAKTDFEEIRDKVGGTFNKETKDGDEIPGGDGNNLIKRHSTFSYENLKHSNRYERQLMSPSEFNDATFRSKAKTQIDTNNLAVRVTNAFGTGEPGEAINERHKGMKINEGIGDVKGFHKVELNSELGNIKGNTRSSNVDKVNILPYGLDYSQTADADLKDFIKFRFKDIVNNKFIIFRAILEGITDTVTPEYSEENYIGRPDKVYVYQGADRDISFTFSIYPKTKQELPFLIEKLNYLVGLCYPTFSQTERMQTPFMELTMGDMYNGAPGVLRGLTITVEEQSTWELDEGLQFPHFIKAACEFRLIGNHVPDARGQHYDLGGKEGFKKFQFETPVGANLETTQQQ